MERTDLKKIIVNRTNLKKDNFEQNKSWKLIILNTTNLKRDTYEKGNLKNGKSEQDKSEKGHF